MGAWLLIIVVAATIIAWRLIGVAGDLWREQAHVTARCIIRIVINEALQILRFPYRKWERLGIAPGERGVTQQSLDESVQAREDLRLVWKAIGELRGTRREVVILRAAGYEYEEIAARLGVTISTVRSHISYARQQLARLGVRGSKGARE